jgi:hypothetical protein
MKLRELRAIDSFFGPRGGGGEQSGGLSRTDGEGIMNTGRRSRAQRAGGRGSFHRERTVWGISWVLYYQVPVS